MKNFLKQNIIGIICLVLMLICTHFCISTFISITNYRNATNKFIGSIYENKANNYLLFDTGREQTVGVVSTDNIIRTGDYITLDDDIYKVTSMGLYCEKNKEDSKDNKRYTGCYYKVLVTFVSKMRK